MSPHYLSPPFASPVSSVRLVSENDKTVNWGRQMQSFYPKVDKTIDIKMKSGHK